MSCYHPRPCFEQVNETTGEIFFHLWKPIRGLKILSERQAPCEQCSGCREGQARSWALRCLHESYSHEQNSFLTLTVDQEHAQAVFPGGSLCYPPFQKFIRAFRKKLKKKVRFFMCGEYGERFSRPHYHSVIFGWFPTEEDRTLYKDTQAGPLYTSRLISGLWENGFHTVGRFDISCALYVAGYVNKKINGKLKEQWYQGREPEFAKMSLKPGLGEGFYKSFTGDMYRKDGITLRGGAVVPIPRYYDKLHERYHPSHMAKVKLKRMEPNPQRDWNNTPDRLAVREEVHKARLARRNRSFEQGV